MKQEDKNAQSRRKILDAALGEFSAHGYDGASLNTVWAENGISKGNVYHYFKDKDQLYLLCVGECFDALTAYLEQAAETLSGAPEQRARDYFDARLRFFAEKPGYLGLFCDAALRPPEGLREQVLQCRAAFDRLNIRVLSALLESRPLRPGLTVAGVVEAFWAYMDFFNLRYCSVGEGRSPQKALRLHEEECHRQLDILLHGVLEARA